MPCLIGFRACNAFLTGRIEPIMRNIVGRKNYLLHLIFAFVFDAFLPPVSTNQLIRRYGRIYRDMGKPLKTQGFSVGL